MTPRNDSFRPPRKVEAAFKKLVKKLKKEWRRNLQASARGKNVQRPRCLVTYTANLR